MRMNPLIPEDRLVDPGGIEDIDVRAPSALDTHQHAWRGIQSIVVGCDGLPTGDAAVRLAGRLATQTGALVRAVMWLDHSRLGPAAAGLTPVEDAIESVDRQLAAATDHPEWWRLTLLTAGGNSFADVCNEESADLIILPGVPTDPLVKLPGAGSIPTARVFGDAEGVPRVVLGAVTTPDGESTARAIATVIHVVTGSVGRQPDHARSGIQVVTNDGSPGSARTDPNSSPDGRRAGVPETGSSGGLPIMRVLAIAIVAYFTGICALRVERPAGATVVRGAVHALAAQLPAAAVSGGNDDVRPMARRDGSGG